MAMNHKQREYALTRVNQILANRLGALATRFKAEVKLLTDRERADLLRKGKVKLKASVEQVTTWTDVVDAFDFSPFEQREKTTPEYAPAAKALEDEAQKVRDQIMLGDAEEAMRLLESFSS